VQLVFSYKDPIFRLAEAEQDREEVTEFSQCNCCGDKAKLKHCAFCGQLTCPKHLDHQRMFPADKPKHSTQVCQNCESKVLYREALFEMLAKMEVWDALVEMGEEWLKEDMYLYDKQVARNVK
jgi:hypothetical protein